MPYKDKTKGREAHRELMRKRREGVTLGTEEAAKLLMVINAMDKEVRGLDGKVNLLTMTRYGVRGLTLAEIKPMLGG